MKYPTTPLLGNPYTNIKSDGSDLRFYDINNNSCSYWIEGTFNRTRTSIVWVNIPTNGVNALFMFYGNSAAPVVSDGAATFDFFDDFTSLTANWSTNSTGGSVIQSGTNAALSNTNGGTVGI